MDWGNFYVAWNEIYVRRALSSFSSSTVTYSPSSSSLSWSHLAVTNVVRVVVGGAWHTLSHSPRHICDQYGHDDVWCCSWCWWSVIMIIWMKTWNGERSQVSTVYKEGGYISKDNGSKNGFKWKRFHNPERRLRPAGRSFNCSKGHLETCIVDLTHF